MFLWLHENKKLLWKGFLPEEGRLLYQKWIQMKTYECTGQVSTTFWPRSIYLPVETVTCIVNVIDLAKYVCLELTSKGLFAYSTICHYTSLFFE